MVKPNGPIEFISDRVSDQKGPTEFGGDAGLIQKGGGVTSLGGAIPAHLLSGSEQRGVIVRAVGAVKVNPLDGSVEDDPAGQAVDPLTGAVVDDEWNLDGQSTKPVEVPPTTEKG